MSIDPADAIVEANFWMSAYSEKLLSADLSRGQRGTKEFTYDTVCTTADESVSGQLCESWEILQDPIRVVFKIRKGVMFQAKSGVMQAREMTANDVKFCFDRLMGSDSKIPKSRFVFVDSITTPDKYTVVFTFKSFASDWAYIIGYGSYDNIYPQELVTAGIKNWKNACGTGPFIWADYVPAASLTYDRNPNYWGKETINRKEYSIPFVDKLIYPLVVDDSTRLAALRTGKVDIIDMTSWKYKKGLEETNPELVRYQKLVFETYSVAVRNDISPFNDIKVRQALSMAIDRQAILNSIYGGNGLLLNFPASVNQTFYTPLEKLPESTRQFFEYNPDKAKQLLTEAGYPKDLTAELLVSTVSTEIDIMTMVASYWEKVGVKVQLKPAEYATFMSMVNGKTYKHMVTGGTSTGTPLSCLRWYYLAGQNGNRAMVSDPHFDELYEKVRSTIDPMERTKIFTEINQWVLAKSYYILLPGSYAYMYVWPWVKNFYGEYETGYYDQTSINARIWIDQTQKKKMGH